jgi:hypothetical protein
LILIGVGEAKTALNEVNTAKIGALKNTISPFKGGNLTNAGRPVTKHSGNFGF